MSNRDNKSAREEKLAGNLRVAELVKVVRFDAQTMTIDAQPLVQTNIDGVMANQPQLTGVPVAALSMGDFTIRPWYQKGDVGLIVICDKDIDTALDGEIAPMIIRFLATSLIFSLVSYILGRMKLLPTIMKEKTIVTIIENAKIR